MSFVIDLDQINDWKFRQRQRLASHSLSPLAELQEGRGAGNRMMDRIGAVLPLGLPFVFFFLLIRFSPLLGNGSLRIFAYLALIAFTGAAWKVGKLCLEDVPLLKGMSY